MIHHLRVTATYPSSDPLDIMEAQWPTCQNVQYSIGPITENCVFELHRITCDAQVHCAHAQVQWNDTISIHLLCVTTLWLYVVRSTVSLLCYSGVLCLPLSCIF